MATVHLTWTLPAEDVNDATSIDALDNGTVVGTVPAGATDFMTSELPEGDHAFTVIVRSKAGAAFDSDPSNTATVTVPPASVKLTAVSDLAAALA